MASYLVKHRDNFTFPYISDTLKITNMATERNVQVTSDNPGRRNLN